MPLMWTNIFACVLCRFKIQDVLLPYTLHRLVKFLICKFPFTQKYKTQKKYKIYLKEIDKWQAFISHIYIYIYI